MSASKISQEDLEVLASLLIGEGWHITALTSGFLSSHGKGKYRRTCKVTLLLTDEGCTVFIIKGKVQLSKRIDAGQFQVELLMDMALK